MLPSSKLSHCCPTLLPASASSKYMFRLNVFPSSVIKDFLMTQIEDLQTCEACPFLGFKDDHKTHIAAPSTRNYCHHFSQACGISKEIQTSFCLKGKLNECPLAMLSPTSQAPRDLLRQPKTRSLLRRLVKSLV